MKAILYTLYNREKSPPERRLLSNGSDTRKAKLPQELADLYLHHLALTLGNVVALAEALQLHFGLGRRGCSDATDKVSVHIEQHNATGAVKRIAIAMELDGQSFRHMQCGEIAVFRETHIAESLFRPATFRNQCIAIHDT